MLRRRLPLLGALAGVAVGLLVALPLIASGSLDDRATAAPPVPATGPFEAAFQRSLLGTYVVEADYTRTLDSGATLKSGALVVQAPPDHLRREFGEIDGAIGGHIITCSTESTGQFHCGPSATTEDYQTQVTQDMANLAAYFAPPALYQVTRAGGTCFHLTQVRPYPTAPYGSEARMCFDQATGAMSYLHEQLEGATDTFSAVHIRPQVTAADLSLARDKAYDSHYDQGSPGG